MYSDWGNADGALCELKSQYGHLRTHHGMWMYSDSGGSDAAFPSPSGRRWREAPDEGSGPNKRLCISEPSPALRAPSPGGRGNKQFAQLRQRLPAMADAILERRIE